MGSCSSETELCVIRAGDGDALPSVDWLGSGSGTKPPDWTLAADERGDKLSLGVSEPVTYEPIADNTEVGDWFSCSCSETDIFGDTDSIGCFGVEVSLLGIVTSFLG